MIEIYRFERYINCVSDYEELLTWIRLNVPPGETNALRLPDTANDTTLLNAAKINHYTIKVINDKNEENNEHINQTLN